MAAIDTSMGVGHRPTESPFARSYDTGHPACDRNARDVFAKGPCSPIHLFGRPFLCSSLPTAPIYRRPRSLCPGGGGGPPGPRPHSAQWPPPQAEMQKTTHGTFGTFFLLTSVENGSDGSRGEVGISIKGTKPRSPLSECVLNAAVSSLFLGMKSGASTPLQVPV